MDSISTEEATKVKSQHFYFYDDVIQAVGGFGKWQMKVLSVLWMIMFVCGFNSNIHEYMKFSPPEFVCKLPECQSYDLSWMSNKTTSRSSSTSGLGRREASLSAYRDTTGNPLTGSNCSSRPIMS